MWQLFLEVFQACLSVASQQLWYAHYDGSSSFIDFIPFGGWSRPNIKQYQWNTTLCGVDVDLDYYWFIDSLFI